MKMNYNEVQILLRNIGYANWYPDFDNLILVQEWGNYTFLKQRFDNLRLEDREFKKAIRINPISENLWKVSYLTREELKEF